MPCLEADRQRPVDRCRGAIVSRREVCGEIVENFGLHLRRARQIDHGRGEELPVITGIAGATLDQAGAVTGRADGVDSLAAIIARLRESSGRMAKRGGEDERGERMA